MFKHGFPPEWSTFKKLIWLVGSGIAGASYIWKTVTGTLIHITDALASPMQKCEVTLEPIQDLHGQDAPYPAGGGKNKFNPSAATVGINWNGSAMAYSIASDYISVEVGKSYTISVADMPKYTGVTVAFLDADKNYVTNGSSTTFDITDGIAFIRISFRCANTDVWTESDLNAAKIQVEIGSTATPWSPYENICPITGWTGCEVKRTGKNLFDETQYQNLTTTYEYVSQTYHCKSIQLKPNTKYTVSQRAGVADSSVIALLNNVESVNDSGYFDLRTVSSSKTYTTDGTGKLYIGVLYSNDTDYNARLALCKLQIELGETASDYEAFQGNTYSVTFPDSTGTVYGGTVDLVSGVLVVEYAEYIFTGRESWQASSTPNRYFISNFNNYIPYPMAAQINVTDYVQNVISSVFGTFVYKNKDGVGYIVTASETSRMLVINTTSATTVDEISALMTGTQLVYELATPITYQLTPQEISTLAGENNVWSNTNSDTTIIYKAQAE